MKNRRPILVYYVSMYAMTPKEQQEALTRFANSIERIGIEDEYINLILPTREENHRVELLNPNLLDEDLEAHDKKLEDMKTLLKEFTKNQKILLGLEKSE